jgi:hypothetical protein
MIEPNMDDLAMINFSTFDRLAHTTTEPHA